MAKTKNTTKITRFVQLGEKRNGKIYKNEQYELNDFYALFSKSSMKAEIVHPSNMDRILNTKKYKKYIKTMAQVSVDVALMEYSSQIYGLINKLIIDDVTKKTKDKKGKN